jgi:hypothetical protein
MALIYESDKGKGREKIVEGFVPCRSDDLSFAKAKGWKTHTKSLEFTTGHHEWVHFSKSSYNDLHTSSTLLKITGLQSAKSSRPGRTQEVPSNVKFSTNVSRYNDVLLMPPPPVPQHTAPSSRRVTYVQHLEELERRQSLAVKDADRQDAERQSSLISSMNSDLEDMMQPEQITQGDTQTQGAFQHSAFEDAVTVTPTTFRGRSVQSSHLHTPITTDTFLLLAETQQTIAARKPYLLQSASALAKKAGGRTESGQMMLCQCGFGKDEGDTVWTSLMHFIDDTI